MAITANHLTTSSSTTDASSYTTASISPTANRLVLVAVGHSIISPEVTTNIPTVSGAGMNWTQVMSVLGVSSARRLTVFRALSGSPSSGVLTIDFAGQIQERCEWSVTEFANVNTSGVNGENALKQVVGGAADGTLSGLSIGLATFDNANNATYGALRLNSSSPATQGPGFTELGESSSDASGDIETQWRNDSDTQVDWSWTSGSNFKVQGLAAELVGTTTSTSSSTSLSTSSTSSSTSSTSSSTSSTSTSTTTVPGTIIPVATIKEQPLTDTPTTSDATLVDDPVALVDDPSALVGGPVTAVEDIKSTVSTPRPFTDIPRGS